MPRGRKLGVMQDLRNQCNALDLSTTGSEAELEGRIKRKEERTEIKTIHSPPQYAAVDAIIAKKGGGNRRVRVRRSLSGNPSNRRRTGLSGRRNGRRGNEEGLSLWKDIHNLQTDNSGLKQRTSHLEPIIENRNATVSIL